MCDPKYPRWWLLLAFLLPSTLATVTAQETNFTSAFACDLYARLRTGDGNLFFSPYSISTCLAMTYAGARGETEKEMAKVLHFGGRPETTHAAFAVVQRQLNKLAAGNVVELNIANGLWAQKDYAFLKPFQEIATRDYAAALNQVDFLLESDVATHVINDWVNARTQGRITELFPRGALTPATRLALVNAIYFKAAWASPFTPSHTRNEIFHAAGGQNPEVRMMTQKAFYGYADLPEMQALQMPYRGNDLEALVLLPKPGHALAEVESALTPESLAAWRDATRPQKVEVFLPKFKLTIGFNLTETLERMGMPSAFSRAADFSGMNGRRDLQISCVYHKAFVDVNEEGTEAAAATGVGMRAMAIAHEQPIPVFRADHPFLFLIRDRQTRTILFLGRVMDPQK